ncbi:hypothetical protein Chor_005332 [Crotalus horridus]
MAGNQQPVRGETPETRLILMPSGSSSKEMSASGASEHPNSLGHVTSSSNLSSLTVPVRLDVLYFLLNSAAKGAQNALAPLPIQNGQGSIPACRGPVALQAGSCCASCRPTCHNAAGSAPYAWCPRAPPCDETVYRNCYSDGRLSTGIPDRQNNQRIRAAQWDDGKNWSGSTQADPARGWKRSQSPLGWKERQRDEGGRYRKGDNWRGKQGDSRKPWSNHRESLAESTPWSSGSLNRKREATSFGEPSLNIKQKRDGNCWPEMCDGSKGQRYLTHAQIEWQKNQGPQEPASFIDNTAAAQMTSTTGQDKREDWEAEYKSTQETSSAPECSSLQSKEMNTSEAGDSYGVESAPSTDLPKQILESSPQFPKSVSQDQAATPTEMEPTASDSNWRKNGRFVHYLQSLYSDVPEKSSSECSAELTINIDAEKSKPEEEEEEATKSASDGEFKLLE